MLLLDSTVLIDILRGRPAARRARVLAVGGDTLLTTPVNVEEVQRGTRPGEQRAFDDLIEALAIPQIATSHALAAGRWRREFALQGVTLTQADCLVAAVAAAHGGRLATGNPKHFPMAELTVEHWPVGQ